MSPDENVYPDADGRIYDLVIHWKVTNYCNFSCHGCSGQAIRIKPNQPLERINLSAFKEFLKKLNKTVKIVFSGGEPFLIENLVDVFAEISREHYIVCITNLTNPQIRDFAERINPERVVIIKASAHLQQLETYKLLDTYLEHYNLIQKKGFNIVAEEVAYPILAGKADAYRKLFQANGITLNFQAFRGKWKDKNYPESYTEEECAIFNFQGFGSGSTAMHNRKNLPCNAGYNVIIAKSSGVLYPCYQLYKRLGSIYKNVNLQKKLIRCPFNYCDCPLAVFDPHLYKKALNLTKEYLYEEK